MSVGNDARQSALSPDRRLSTRKRRDGRSMVGRCAVPSSGDVASAVEVTHLVVTSAEIPADATPSFRVER